MDLDHAKQVMQTDPDVPTLAGVVRELLFSVARIEDRLADLRQRLDRLEDDARSLR